MWNFKLRAEYEALVADLERSGAVQAMRFLPQTALSFCERYSDRILGFLLILLGTVQCLRG